MIRLTSVLGKAEKKVFIGEKSYIIQSYVGSSSIEVFLLTDESRNLIASCSVDINTGLISSVVTVTPYRRKGFCEFLLRFVIAEYGANYLFVLPYNIPAIKLYAKLGFRVTSKVILPTNEVAFTMRLKEDHV